MSHAYLGVDPGLNGAVAVMRGSSVRTWDMPTMRAVVNRKAKRLLDLRRLVDMVAGIAALEEPRVAIVENVHSMPKQGVVSSFTFGGVSEAAKTALVAARIPIHLVSPAVWKRAMRLSRDKDASRQRASQLFPSCSAQWARKKDDGRAEAALLAWYGSRMQ
jgi:crossover junction endodeoxyribonuclease RuvC